MLVACRGAPSKAVMRPGCGHHCAPQTLPLLHQKSYPPQMSQLEAHHMKVSLTMMTVLQSSFAAARKCLTTKQLTTSQHTIWQRVTTRLHSTVQHIVNTPPVAGWDHLSCHARLMRLPATNTNRLAALYNMYAHDVWPRAYQRPSNRTACLALATALLHHSVCCMSTQTSSSMPHGSQSSKDGCSSHGWHVGNGNRYRGNTPQEYCVEHSLVHTVTGYCT